MTSYEVIIRPKTAEIKSQDEIRFTIEAPSLPDGNESDLVDVLENAAMGIGVQIERGLFTNQLKRIEMKLCNSLTHLDDNCEVVRNGYRKLKIGARFGVINIERQVAFCKTCGKDFIPLNSVLPEHNGMIITKGLQELACFLSMFSSYRIAQRLLGWSCHDLDVLCSREVEDLVGYHGAMIRKRELEEARAIEKSGDTAMVVSRLKESNQPQKQSWPEETKEAILEALKRGESEPPSSIPKRDWDRIVQYLKDGQDQGELIDPCVLANLGPRPKEGEAVVFSDGVVINGRKPNKKPEHIVIVLWTKDGMRHFSGDHAISLLECWLNALRPSKITIIGDGARWIREGLYHRILGYGYDTTLVLDWYHLCKRVSELLSMVCNRKKHRNEVFSEIKPLLWNGKVDEAISKLRESLSDPRNPERLKELIGYLEARKPAIQDYNMRRINCEYNGNGIVEKANDLLVARRQKLAGMSWSKEGSDALCALTTLWYNGEWDGYWCGQVAA